jgi:hypothetical protein
MEIKTDEIKIICKPTKTKGQENGMVAMVTLDFGDMAIHGYRIRTSKHQNKSGDYLWITPPSYQDKSGKYHPVVFIERKVWAEIEARIVDDWKHNTNYIPIIEDGGSIVQNS